MGAPTAGRREPGHAPPCRPHGPRYGRAPGLAPQRRMRGRRRPAKRVDEGAQGVFEDQGKGQPHEGPHQYLQVLQRQLPPIHAVTAVGPPQSSEDGELYRIEAHPLPKPSTRLDPGERTGDLREAASGVTQEQNRVPAAAGRCPPRRDPHGAAPARAEQRRPHRAGQGRARPGPLRRRRRRLRAPARAMPAATTAFGRARPPGCDRAEAGLRPDGVTMRSLLFTV